MEILFHIVFAEFGIVVHTRYKDQRGCTFDAMGKELKENWKFDNLALSIQKLQMPRPRATHEHKHTHK